MKGEGPSDGTEEGYQRLWGEVSGDELRSDGEGLRGIEFLR